MKKTLVCLIFAVAIAVTSLIILNSTNPEKVKVLELSSESLNAEVFFPHKNEIQRSSSFVDEEKVDDIKDISFLGRTYRAVYDSTWSFALGNLTMDGYEIPGEDKRFLIHPDGSWYCAMGGVPERLEITKYADAETVKELVKEALNGEIDFDRYLYCRTTKCDVEVDGGFGWYEYVWYNQNGDAMLDDWSKVFVLQNGEITSIIRRDFLKEKLNAVEQVISLADYYPFIEQKLRSIYSDKYQSYSVKRSKLTVVNGELSIYCDIDVLFPDTEEWSSDHCELIISCITE